MVGNLDGYLNWENIWKVEHYRLFKVVKGVGDSYDIVKEKLLDWYNDNEENRKLKNFKLFEEMSYSSGQELYLYSCELENAFTLAYPKYDAINSSILQRKFMATIPKSAKKLLGSYRMFK